MRSFLAEFNPLGFPLPIFNYYYFAKWLKKKKREGKKERKKKKEQKKKKEKKREKKNYLGERGPGAGLEKFYYGDISA